MGCDGVCAVAVLTYPVESLIRGRFPPAVGVSAGGSRAAAHSSCALRGCCRRAGLRRQYGSTARATPPLVGRAALAAVRAERKRVRYVDEAWQSVELAGQEFAQAPAQPRHVRRWQLTIFFGCGGSEACAGRLRDDAGSRRASLTPKGYSLDRPDRSTATCRVESTHRSRSVRSINFWRT